MTPSPPLIGPETVGAAAEPGGPPGGTQALSAIARSASPMRAVTLRLRGCAAERGLMVSPYLWVAAAHTRCDREDRPPSPGRRWTVRLPEVRDISAMSETR